MKRRTGLRPSFKATGECRWNLENFPLCRRHPRLKPFQIQVVSAALPSLDQPFHIRHTKRRAGRLSTFKSAIRDTEIPQWKPARHRAILRSYIERRFLFPDPGPVETIRSHAL